MNFKENPFGLLDASPRDSKRVLHDKAESKAFELPEEVCRNAENILITPKKRLEAELAWFPGVSPKKVKELLPRIKDNAENGALSFRTLLSLDSLARTNALALLLAGIAEAEFDKDGVDQAAVKEFVEEFCRSAGSIDVRETLKLINCDRVASGFAEVQDDEAVAQGLQNMQRVYKQILHDFLDGFDSSLIVEVLTELIEDSTAFGEEGCEYPLLDDLISDYEVEATAFFDKQEEKIGSGIEALTGLMRSKASAAELDAGFKILKDNVLLWDRVAQPIQVLCRSKGMDHKRSFELYHRLRQLAVKAHNDYDCTELSIKITDLQQSVFEELRQASEIARDDKKELQKLEREKFERLRDAAGRGAAEAQFAVGRCYEKGNGVDQDYAQAVGWYLKAAEQSYTEAQHVLGVFYAAGLGVTKNFKKAMDWFRRAAELGHVEAQYNLALCLSTCEDEWRDLGEAAMWLRKAAEGGHAKSQYRLGQCYADGRGVDRDFKQAVRWYLEAAERGNRDAKRAIEAITRL